MYDASLKANVYTAKGGQCTMDVFQWNKNTIFLFDRICSEASNSAASLRQDLSANSQSTSRNPSLWKIRKKYFLVWYFNWNWNWNWDGSWNDLRECQKLWGGLCILYRTYRHEVLGIWHWHTWHWHLGITYTGGEALSIIMIQNTQASPEFLTLPQVIPTSIPIPIPIPIKIPK